MMLNISITTIQVNLVLDFQWSLGEAVLNFATQIFQSTYHHSHLLTMHYLGFYTFPPLFILNKAALSYSLTVCVKNIILNG